MAFFLPIHIAYVGIILMGVLPGWGGSAECDTNVIYPNIMIANDCLFFSVYIMSIIFHKKKYFLTWDIVSDEVAKLSIESYEKNEIAKMKKAVFE